MKSFEKLIIQELMANAHLSAPSLEEVASRVELEFSGAGYFLSFASEFLPSERVVLDKPRIEGKLGELEVGYIGFIENSEFTLECFAYGDSLEISDREKSFSRR